MNIKKLLVPAIALMIGLAHAAPAVAAPADTSAEDDRADKAVTVRVVNNNWADMRIYAIVEGRRPIRLGTVTSFSTEILKIRRSAISSGGDVELVAVAIGSRSALYSDQVVVVPGDLLEFRVENAIGAFLRRM